AILGSLLLVVRSRIGAGRLPFGEGGRGSQARGALGSETEGTVERRVARRRRRLRLLPGGLVLPLHADMLSRAAELPCSMVESTETMEPAPLPGDRKTARSSARKRRVASPMG